MGRKNNLIFNSFLLLLLIPSVLFIQGPRAEAEKFNNLHSFDNNIHLLNIKLNTNIIEPNLNKRPVKIKDYVQTRKEESMPAEFENRIRHFIYDGIIIFGINREKIIGTLGEPRSIRIEKKVNPYNKGITDEIFELIYDGLKIAIYKTNDPKIDKEYVFDMLITSKKYKMKWGLEIGSSKQLIERTLGEPQKYNKGRLYYEVSFAPGSTYAEFILKGNEVTEIHLHIFIN